MPENVSQLQSTAHENDAISGSTEANHLTTRGVIVDNFVQTRDLTVIQVQDTILIESGDESRGANRFISLMNNMAIKTGPFISPFEIKWLVSDISQLRHVIRETKARAVGVFNALNAHSTVTVMESTSDTHRIFHEFYTENCQTITAFPSQKGEGYDCYENFVPQIDRTPDNRPLCTLADATTKEIQGLINKLHIFHVKRMNRQSRTGIDNNKFSILSLEELIA